MARKRCVLRWGAAVGLYWAACAAHVWRTGGLLALGLAWNMLLALLPLCFACAAGRCRLWAGRAALAVLWLLFLPNTFYMLTDLIHTPQNMEWVNAADWTVRHSENVSDWLLTLLLGTGAVLAVLLGLEAMRVFRVYCCVHWPRPAVWAGGGTVLLLCGFGMYIGRFLWLNSWDILHPLALLRRIWASMDAFQLQVTLLFAGAVFLLWLAYSALRPVDGEKQENIKSQDDTVTAPKQDDGGDTVKVGRVTSSRVNMRIGPGTSYNSLKKLEKNTGVYILGQSGNWYSVQTGQLKGYVHKDYIQQTGTQKVNGGSDAAGRGVTTGSVRLRKGSNTDSAIIATLKKDTELILYGKKDGWYSVKTSDGTEGFVSSKYVKVTEAYAGGEQQNAGRAESDDAIGTGKTNTKVNMRQGPSSSTKKLVRLPKGTEVTIYANENGWCLVEYKGTRGYIYAKYVTGTVHDKGTAVGTGENDKDTAANVDSGSGVVLPRGETNSKVNFRSGPNTKNTKVYETLKKGA